MFTETRRARQILAQGPCLRIVLLTSAALFFGASSAHAQAGTSSAPDVAPVPAVTAQSNEGLSDSGDIIVTANRREQRLRDVGVSITALDSDTLGSLSITDSTQVIRAVPGLKFNGFSSVGIIFNIRGVAQNDFGDQQEPPVASYQDDSYASSISFAGFPTFDLDRVEVLRGPQGTLFGRNATGGAIRFMSKQPTKDFDAAASVTYGSYNQLIIEGAVSGPITDNLQVRVAGLRNTADGYLKNITTGVPAEGGADNYALRGIVAWQPSDATDISLTARYARNDHERQSGQYSWIAAAPNADGQGEYTTTGPDFLGYQNDAIDPERGGNPYRLAGCNGYDCYIDRKLYGATLRMETEIGGVRLVSITDYQHVKKHYQEDGDATPLNYFTLQNNSKIDQYSQEIRLSSQLGRHFVTGGVFGMAINGRYRGSYDFPAVIIDPAGTSYQTFYNFTQKTRSYAVFLQDEWAFSEEFKLIGGIRYWHDRRKVDYVTSDNAGALVIFNDQLISPAVSGISPSAANRSYEGVTLKAEIDYKPNSRTLVYASYNRGSKSGGFTLPTAPPAIGNEAAFIQGLSYEPETLHDFELGVKATIAPNTTLNASGFYYIYNNYQAYAQYGFLNTIINLNARSKGAEIEFASRPIDGLTLQLSVSFLDSNVKGVPLPLGRLVEKDLPQAPGVSGNALIRYEIPAGQNHVAIQMDGTYQSSSCFTTLCAPVEREPAYALLNGRVEFAHHAGWQLAFFVNNITDHAYRFSSLDVASFFGSVEGIYAKPRTWGLTATVKFGQSAR